MLIKKPDDIKSSEITPEDMYLNRRKFLTAAGVAKGKTFEITAEGTWAFEINAPGAARTFDGRNDQGNGDDVVFYDGDPTTAHITFGGDGPFVVSSFANNGAVDQLVDEAAGPYDDSVGFPGPALVAISGDGRWTISLG